MFYGIKLLAKSFIFNIPCSMELNICVASKGCSFLINVLLLRAER